MVEESPAEGVDWQGDVGIPFDVFMAPSKSSTEFSLKVNKQIKAQYCISNR
jgi:hypothetical protein